MINRREILSVDCADLNACYRIIFAMLSIKSEAIAMAFLGKAGDRRIRVRSSVHAIIKRAALPIPRENSSMILAL